MLDDLAKESIKALIKEMGAVSDGEIDHKTRMSAIKEANHLILHLLPRLSKEDKDKISKSIVETITEKLPEIIRQEERLLELNSDIADEVDDTVNDEK